MNKLVIIGNGFDLAHDLKTRYTDFLLWYLHYTVKIRILQPYTAYDDGLTSYAAAKALFQIDT